MLKRSPFPRPVWFPDWTGETVVVVGAGPSANLYDYAPYKDRAKWIAINRSWKLVPWADFLISADAGFWLKYDMVPEFKGGKVTMDFNVAHNHGLHRIQIDKMTDGISTEKPGYVGMGCNSGFYGINLAVQFGPPSKIILAGFDMNLAKGIHWHGKHPSGMNNPNKEQLKRWAGILDRQAARLKALGVSVVNVTPDSAVKAYPKMTLAESFQ